MNRLTIRWLAVPTVGLAIFSILAGDPRETVAGRELDEEHPELVAIRSDLEAQHAHIATRVTYKEALILRLIEGEASYAQTIDEFLRLNREHPPILAIIRMRYPVGSDEEKTAQNVLEYVRGRVPADGSGDRLLARLEREFEARFGHAPERD
jgi:hypothetical protein